MKAQRVAGEMRTLSYKAPVVQVRQCSVGQTWTWINYKCVLKTRGQPLRTYKAV